MKVARLNTAYMRRLLHFVTSRRGLDVQHGQGVGSEVTGEKFDGKELQGGGLRGDGWSIGEGLLKRLT